MNYSISEYPLVIDPVTASIEVHVAFELPTDQPGQGRSGWRQFVRLTIDGNDGHHGLPFVPTAAKVHIFGDADTLAASRLLLVYGHRGGINCLLHRNVTHPTIWENYDIPEEFTGYSVRPSIRLCFDTREACVEAMGLLDSLRTAYSHGTSVLPDAQKLCKLLVMNPEMIYAPVLKVSNKC